MYFPETVAVMKITGLVARDKRGESREEKMRANSRRKTAELTSALGTSSTPVLLCRASSEHVQQSQASYLTSSAHCLAHVLHAKQIGN
jgi:hypothetical protein